AEIGSLVPHRAVQAEPAAYPDTTCESAPGESIELRSGSDQTLMRQDSSDRIDACHTRLQATQVPHETVPGDPVESSQAAARGPSRHTPRALGVRAHAG